MAESTNPVGSNFRVSYRKAVVKRLSFIVICAVVCLMAAVYSVTLGTYPISPGEVLSTIWKTIIGQTVEDATVRHIVIDLRLPRIIAAIVCGFGLAICGTAMQSMLKNPLADPYTMGISSGASFGAALAIILGIEVVAGGGIIANAFIFALIPSMVIIFLSKFRKATPTMMVLSGISIMYLFNAMTQLFMLIADPDDMDVVYTWSVGSVSGVTYENLFIVIPIVVIGSLYVQYMANQLNVMGIGDESAKTLGVDVERKRLIFLIVVTLVAAAIVSFTGVIGFIGLVSPHIVRAIIGTDNKFLIPAAGAFGSLLLVVSDIVARTIVAPTVLPVGVITSCIGGPMFLYLVMRNSKEVWS